jgi:hypothetical protein
MQADRLGPGRVQADLVASTVDGSQCVPPRLWPAAAGVEHQRRPLADAQQLCGLPGSVRS